MKNYRLCITCPAKHNTYDNYKTLKSAIKNLVNMQDKTDWHATHIEITDKYGGSANMENNDYIKIIELSDDVIKICKENYSKKCGTCGLRQKCISHIGTGSHCLNKWILSINKLAESITQDTCTLEV